ncbi:phage major capsid protein [Bacillus altitudinis]|uniref:phage major capsid protein n=1 Tax=Bacillus altitudinis TaxID=293387 RepID=UPI001F602282|nr:phage major capsid protein [Bacillus altitudinis]
MFDKKVNDKFYQKLAQLDNVSDVRNNTVELNDKEKEIRGFKQFLRKQDGAELRAMVANSTPTTGQTSGAIMIPTHLHNTVVEKMYEVAPIFKRTKNFKPANGKLEVLAEE